VALMIPAFIDPETASPGEKEVFEGLKHDPLAANWTVLHSVNLPHHPRHLEGEMDFLVLIPGAAAICAEVKAHRRVTRDSAGLWRMGGDDPQVKSPFRQASEAMHSINNMLKSSDAAMGGIPFFSVVVFTHCSFDVPATEWETWQAIDERLIAQRGLASALLGAAHQFRRKCLASHAAWFRDERAQPTEQECAAIARRVRPAFDLAQSPKAQRARKLKALEHFTQEQFRALDALEMNSQVVFTGAAGTGKTYLALEAARRSAAEGKSTFLCCFNRILGEWLKAQEVAANPLVKVGTLHSLMLEISGEQPGHTPDSSFWDQLIYKTEEALLADGNKWAEAYDMLVLDEAQDLTTAKYLGVFDLLLAGGLANGSYRMFGDFDGQAIFTNEDGRTELKRTSSPALYALRENCRNQPPIGRLVASTSGIPKPYDGFRRPEDGSTPDFKTYSSPDEQLAHLDQSIDELRGEGYQLGDIVILSTRLDAIWKHVSQPNADRLSAASGVPGHKIRCGTVQAFKGLDAPAVIVTDVDDVASVYGRQLLYIACSRATERLVVHVDSSVGPELVKLVVLRGYHSA
jgi:hypothetical protein